MRLAPAATIKAIKRRAINKDCRGQEVESIEKGANRVKFIIIRFANKIADCGPLGIKTSLASAHLAIDRTEEEALSKLDAQFGALFHTQDFLEGQKAEAEGRKPVYQGK
jgi:hypothetical protein